MPLPGGGGGGGGGHPFFRSPCVNNLVTLMVYIWDLFGGTNILFLDIYHLFVIS